MSRALTLGWPLAGGQPTPFAPGIPIPTPPTPPVPPLTYPQGVLNAQPNWDAKSVYELQLASNTGCRIPLSQLKIPTQNNLPSGWVLLVYPGSANVYSRLIPAQGSAPLSGYDLSKFVIYPPDGSKDTITNIEISDNYFGDGFSQSGAGGSTSWIRANSGWIIHHNTMALTAVDSQLGHWLVASGGGHQVYRNRISGFPDDPISYSGGNSKVTSLTYENYVFDALVGPGLHADYINLDGGSHKVYRNLLRCTDQTKYAGFNNAFRSDPTGALYDAEVYNNVTEGWDTTDYPVQINLDGFYVRNVRFHDNVISVGNKGVFYQSGTGGITQSANNLATVSGLSIPEFQISLLPIQTQQGTTSAAVVGSPVSVTGETFDKPQYASYLQWVQIDANGNITKLSGSTTNATYTPVSGDAGKTIARTNQYFTGSYNPNYGVTGMSTSVVVTSS